MLLDTYTAVKRLQLSGLEEKQAEVLVSVLNDLSEKYADQAITKNELKHELTLITSSVTLAIQGIKSEFKTLERDVKWILGILILLFCLTLVTLVKP